MKKVSVIIPIYRGSRYIPNLIRILEENWKLANMVEPLQIEMVLVNDFPQEKLDINAMNAKNVSCIVIDNGQNCGIHFSRVQGLLHADGDYVVFLDQDDIISYAYIREQMQALVDYDAIICNGKNRNQAIYKSKLELARAVNEMEYKNGKNRIVSPGQVLIKRGAIPKKWLEHILKRNGADDYFLWLLMFSGKKKIGIHDKILFWHMITGENTSSNFAEMNNSVFEMAAQAKCIGILTQDEETTIKKSRILPKKNTEEISIEKYEKIKQYKQILELWMELRDRKVSVEHFFIQKGLRRIAIYGAGILGKHLYYELLESDVQIVCFLDQTGKDAIGERRCLIPGANVGLVDAIIITPFLEYEQIQKQLSKYYSCDMISIVTVLLNADCELMTG